MSNSTRGDKPRNPRMGLVKKDIVTSLASSNANKDGNEDYVFSSYKDLVIFSAVLGYREDELTHEGFDNSSDDKINIKYSTFTTEQLHRSVLESLAFQHTGNPDTLVDRNYQMDVLEKYAAGGLQVLDRRLGDIPGDRTDALVNLIQSYADEEGVEHGEELQTILNAFNEDPRVDI
jgi:dnd system-associated protein 4